MDVQLSRGANSVCAAVKGELIVFVQLSRELIVDVQLSRGANSVCAAVKGELILFVQLSRGANSGCAAV